MMTDEITVMTVSKEVLTGMKQMLKSANASAVAFVTEGQAAEEFEVVLLTKNQFMQLLKDKPNFVAN